MTLFVRRRPLFVAGLVAPVALFAFSFALPAADDCVVPTDLVSNREGGGPSNVDSNLRNPWGVVYTGGLYWVADNHAGVATSYDYLGAPQGTAITIPAVAIDAPGSPTGLVVNNTPDFEELGAVPARLLFVTEDGLVVAWHSSIDGSTGRVVADRSSASADYKGVAIANDGASNFLYAADFHNGRIEVFDASFNVVASPGGFQDRTIPKNFAPFNVQNVGGALYVAYAKQDADKEDEVAGRGQGFVNVFDANGFRLRRFVSKGHMNAPWAVTLAPAGFGSYARRLVVGNFGDGTMQTFDLATGRYKGAFRGMDQKPVSIEGLWGLVPGGVGLDQVIWYVAGPNDEADGVAGRLTAGSCRLTVR